MLSKKARTGILSCQRLRWHDRYVLAPSRWLSRVMIVMCLFSLLSACNNNNRPYAPVSDVSTIERIPPKGVHTVRRGETLYAIAWRYGMDYRELAAINHISPPWRVWVGEPIYLKAHAPAHRATRLASVHYRKPHATPHPVFESDIREPRAGRWVWPAKGHLAGVYSSFNRGINLSGHLGDPVYATAAGHVVYAGDGLRGYGNLIIIKHNSAWLSAYAWNSAILVHQGQQVRSGQRIASIGFVGKQRPMLHFEIRNNGSPVNPLRYLSRKSSV